MSKEEFGWGKALSVGAVAGILTFAGVAMIMPNGVDNDAIEKTVEDAVQAEMKLSVDKIDAAIDKLTNLEVVDPNEKVLSASEKILEDDMWEAEAEVLSMEELEKRDYKELRKWVLSNYSGDFNNNTDYDEIEDFEFSVKDVDFDEMDVDDREGTVTVELKVEYETDSGDNVNRYVTVTTEIEDNDVESQGFTETA